MISFLKEFFKKTSNSCLPDVSQKEQIEIINVKTDYFSVGHDIKIYISKRRERQHTFLPNIDSFI